VNWKQETVGRGRRDRRRSGGVGWGWLVGSEEGAWKKGLNQTFSPQMKKMGHWDGKGNHEFEIQRPEGKRYGGWVWAWRFLIHSYVP